MASKAIISQFNIFYSPLSTNRNSNLHFQKSFQIMPLQSRSKISVGIHSEGNGTSTPIAETMTSLKHATDMLKSDIEETAKSSLPSEEPTAEEPVRAAKIHDFCFGIPFGGIILVGGVIEFLFSRNPISLLYGGGLLALSTFSLKAWKQRKSCLPFMLGQAALSAVILRKHFQNYTLTKKVFPAGFIVVLSVVMLCFYSYVLVSGGNPPPKKLKIASSSPS